METIRLYRVQAVIFLGFFQYVPVRVPQNANFVVYPFVIGFQKSLQKDDFAVVLRNYGDCFSLRVLGCPSSVCPHDCVDDVEKVL